MRAPGFATPIARLRDAEAPPMPRAVLYAMLALLAAAIAWAAIGRLDIIAVAQGRLVPATYVKIVQPAEPGVLREILVREGEVVRAGQVLMRMDAEVSDAEGAAVENDLALRRLQLRRIQAELDDAPFAMAKADRPALFAQAAAQYRANREAYASQVESERAVLARAEQDLNGAVEMESRLAQTVPIYREQEAAHGKLVKDGFFSRLSGLDKTRERIEKEQELKAQAHQVASLRAAIEQSRKRLAQIASGHRQQLENERAEANAQRLRLEQEGAKQAYRRGLLELRAPHDGVVKDLATHTAGTVVAPGTILMTLVPRDEPLKAEVWITNEDAGFVEVAQPVKVKVAAYPFHKYGMAQGRVEYLSPDAAELPDVRERDRKDGRSHVMPPSGFRALVALDSPYLERDGRRLRLSPGMLVSAEVNLGQRTVLEYLLSPVQKTVLEAGRER
ncbi:MAG TPA: HlyD family type I secretion periplasmic adaptor subunit [Burkholderiales bacterium]|jgi:HlyD family secretion protein|nr:HlyD family type I secretion periplasmic adaptor subunit [Burkholderiales bacterium]